MSQDEYLESVALAYVQDRLSEALSQDTRRFNRRQNQNSLITMSMSYRPGIRTVVVPASATDVMTQQSTCEQCLCRYSSSAEMSFYTNKATTSNNEALDELVRRGMLSKIKSDNSIDYDRAYTWVKNCLNVFIDNSDIYGGETTIESVKSLTLKSKQAAAKRRKQATLKKRKKK